MVTNHYVPRHVVSIELFYLRQGIEPFLDAQLVDGWRRDSVWWVSLCHLGVLRTRALK